MTVCTFVQPFGSTIWVNHLGDILAIRMKLDDTRTGEMIGGRYLIGKRLGQGGHGEVYRARDTIDLQDVAIKFLAHQIAHDTNYRVRLIREARIMTSLQGLATVAVYGVVGSEDGTPCVVMELMEGKDLSVVLSDRKKARKPFSVQEVFSLFEPIVSTLEVAHANDVVHRDIKPSNFFLVDERVDDARIMDFGLAKAGDLPSITADQMLAGSPSYIAPEIWTEGAKQADSRSDIYSLAVVIYEVFTFGVPIHRKRLTDMFMAATTPGNIPSLHEKRPDLPNDIDDWLKQALATNVANRFQSVVGMWRALQSVLSDVD